MTAVESTNLPRMTGTSPRSRPNSVVTASAMRRAILDASRRADVGHIGSCLSVVDVLAVLFAVAGDDLGTTVHDRDRFILSKGHAGLALYAALQLTGRLDTADLRSFCKDGAPWPSIPIMLFPASTSRPARSGWDSHSVSEPPLPLASTARRVMCMSS